MCDLQGNLKPGSHGRSPWAWWAPIHSYQRPRERGVAMLVVLIAVAMATVLSMSFLASQATSHGVSQNVQRHAQARSVAESALVVGINYVQTDSSWRSDKSDGQWVSSVSFNGGTFDLYGNDGLDTDGDGVVDDTDGDLSDDSSDPVTLTAIGYFEGVSHTVHAVVTQGTAVVSVDVLFVVGNDGSLTTQDQDKINLMNGWGMTVTLIDDGDSQANFDTAMALVDVVYVAGSVDAGTVGSKLTAATIGVVSDEHGMNDGLLVTDSDGADFSDSQIDIINNVHYITATIDSPDMDDLTITTGSEKLAEIKGALGLGAEVLATKRSKTDPTLIAVNAGGQLQNSTSAAGRRVLLPWGSTSIDITELNSTGQTILKRSLEWGGAQVSLQTPSIGIVAAGTFKVKDSAVIDSFYSSMGPYGGSNVGSSAVVSTNQTAALMVTIEAGGVINGNMMVGAGGDPATVISNAGTITGTTSALVEDVTIPTVTAPTGMPASQGNVTISGGTTVYSSDQHFGGWFWAHSDAIIQISGDVTILANGEFWIDGNAQLQILPGSSLTLYLKDKFKGVSSAQVNVNTADPSKLIIYGLSNKHIDIENNAHVYATVIAPLGQLHLKNSSHFYGTYQGDKVEVKDTAQLHQDISGGGVNTGILPRIVALYEFVEVRAPTTMLAHWKLDEPSSTAGSAAGTVKIKDNAFVDSFDSTLGAYGGGNIGSAAELTTNLTDAAMVTIESGAVVNGDVLVGAGGVPGTVISNAGTITGSTSALSLPVTFPTVSEPTGMPASQGNVTISGGTTVYSSDQHFGGWFWAHSDAIIQISGDVTILANGEFWIDGNAQLQILPGSSLTLYLKDKFKGVSSAQVNVNTADPSKLIIYGLSDKHIDIENNAEVYATVHATLGLLHLKNNSNFYGTFQGNKIEVKDSSGFHQDIAGLIDVGGMLALDDVGAQDGGSSGGVVPEQTGFGDGGTAVYFDGVDDYYEITHNDTYLLNGGAISFWFKPDDVSGHHGLFSKDSTGYDTGGQLHIYTDGKNLTAQLQSDSASYTVSKGGLKAGNWFHAVVSFGPAGLNLFLDGSLEDSDSYTGGLGTSSGGAGNYEPIVLGANTWASGDLVASPMQDYFEGTIDDVRIYDQGLDENQADNIYNGSDPGIGSAKGTVVYDTSGYDTALDLVIADTANIEWLGSSLQIVSPTLIISPAAATKLYTALTSTNQMSLEVAFTPANISQSGPARIVSYSSDAADRNFTFGQEGDEYITRLHTTTTTSNGTPSADSGSVLTAGEMEHVIFSYDGAEITMYRDGGSTVTLARTGDFSWDNTFRFMFGDELTGGNDWLGTLHRVAIYDMAFNANQASNVFDGDAPGDGTGSGTASVDWVEP